MTVAPKKRPVKGKRTEHAQSYGGFYAKLGRVCSGGDLKHHTNNFDFTLDTRSADMETGLDKTNTRLKNMTLEKISKYRQAIGTCVCSTSTCLH